MFCINNSTIHGLGMFAIADIPPNTYVRIPGVTTLWSDCDQERVFHLVGNTAFKPDPPFEYLNHCKVPNCEVYEDEDGLFWLHIVSGVKYGQELTIDYGCDTF